MCGLAGLKILARGTEGAVASAVSLSRGFEPGTGPAWAAGLTAAPGTCGDRYVPGSAPQPRYRQVDALIQGHLPLGYRDTGSSTAASLLGEGPGLSSCPVPYRAVLTKTHILPSAKNGGHWNSTPTRGDSGAERRTRRKMFFLPLEMVTVKWLWSHESHIDQLVPLKLGERIESRASKTDMFTAAQFRVVTRWKHPRGPPRESEEQWTEGEEQWTLHATEGCSTMTRKKL